MAKKQPHVPETREARPNREQRRHPEKLERPEDEALDRDERHKKKTAENWNQ